jgi:two-component system probable response regulator PhcQ
VAHRIGTVYALSASIGGEMAVVPVEAYLSAALNTGLTPPEPDWLMMDHSDLISAEAFRSAAFGRQVREQLAQLERRLEGGEPLQALAALADTFGAEAQLAGEGLQFTADAPLAEYLETAADRAVSPQHAAWLATLLWLGQRGVTLQVAKTDGGVQARLARAEAALTPSELAGWVEQF